MVCESVSPLIKVGLGFRLLRKINEAYFLGRGYGSWAVARMAYWKECSAPQKKKKEKKQDKKEKNDQKIRKLGARILDFRGTSWKLAKGNNLIFRKDI